MSTRPSNSVLTSVTKNRRKPALRWSILTYLTLYKMGDDSPLSLMITETDTSVTLNLPTVVFQWLNVHETRDG